MEPSKGYNTNAGAYYYYNREGDLSEKPTKALRGGTKFEAPCLQRTST